eukprot:gene20785-22814_t
MSNFLFNYVDQVESLLRLIRATRQGEQRLYLPALEEQPKFYFAHDLHNYARLVPYHIAQLQELKENGPETWSCLADELFGVKRSGIPFCNLFVDQALEQQIRFLTGLGGIIGITQNEAALERYLLIAPEVKRIVEEFKECFEADQRKERKEHHQDSCSTRSRLHSNAEKLRGSILKHCKENPFSSDIPLMNIKSSMILPPLVARNVIERDKKGNEAYISFVNNRLVADTAEVSMWDPIKKMTLKLFSNWQKKAACKVKDKIIKLREDRQLIARFLVIQKSRPNLSEKLNYVIATYEFSMIPRSLFSGDEVDNSSLKRVCSIDAMAVVQAIKKGTNMSVFADFVKAFVNSIRRVVHGYDEGRVIFDCYIESSLKAQTRAKRVHQK